MIDNIRQLYKDPSMSFIVEPDGQIKTGEIDKDYYNIFPGSFNPLHSGHKAIFDDIDDDRKMFEISLHRVGKSSMTLDDYVRIIEQFRWNASILVTNSPTFMDKIYTLRQKLSLSPTFHIGYDTAIRVKDSYGQYGTELIPATFIVYDRIMDDVRCSILNWTHIPSNMQKGSDRPESLLGISSTMVREIGL